MPLMQIIRNPEPARLIRMGHAPEVIQPEPKAMAAAMPIPEPEVTMPPEPVKNKRGRPAKMAKDKDLSEVGTKTIRKDDPGEQGAIGTHGANAPAQEKVPEKSTDNESKEEE